MKSWLALIITFLGSIFGMTLGYGYSQHQLASIVAVHESRLQTNERQIEEMRRANAEQMKIVVDHWDDVLSVQKEFINTIRLQNEILSREIRVKALNP